LAQRGYSALSSLAFGVDDATFEWTDDGVINNERTPTHYVVQCSEIFAAHAKSVTQR